MGEILEAVLTDSCTYRKTKFYGLEVPNIAAGASATAILNIEQMTYFLCKSISLTVALGVNGAGPSTSSAAVFVDYSVTFLRSGQRLYEGSMVQSNGSVVRGGSTEMEEYPLIGGDENVRVRVTNLTGSVISAFFTFYGIEYKD